MGADWGIHVEVAQEDMLTLQPLHVSKILSALAKKHEADLLIMGKVRGLTLVRLTLPVSTLFRQIQLLFLLLLPAVGHRR